MRRFLKIILLGTVLCYLAVAVAMAAGPQTRTVAGDVLQGFSPGKLYIWTNQLAYVQGQDSQIKLYWTANAEGDPYPYTMFLYLENIQTGERQYVSNGVLNNDVRDMFGNAPGVFQPSVLPTATKQQLISAPLMAVGNWHFVLELRDVAAGQVIKKAYAKFNVVQSVVELGTGAVDTEISQDTTWTADKLYRILHQVFVNDGATLTIEPGTVVVAKGQYANIVVEQGGKINADGRRELPIVMTCDAEVGQRFSGCWAGIIVLGRAPINLEGGQGVAEGVLPANRPVYGGSDPHDSSGVYRYVRIEFAGVDFTDEIQPNAWGMHAVGDGTVLDFIEGHDGEDDDLEFFGGTANVKHFVLTGAKDDSFDLTFGWTGNAQFGLIMQDHVQGDRGWESDNSAAGRDDEPRTHPTVRNVTFIGTAEGNRGFLSREGNSFDLKNFIFMNFGNDGFEENHEETTAAREAGLTTMQYGTFWNNAGGAVGAAQIDSAVRDWVSVQTGIQFVNPMLRNTRYEGNPDPRPMEGSPVLTIGESVAPESDGFFDTSASYVGAFGPSDLWIEEWTFFGDEADYDVSQ